MVGRAAVTISVVTCQGRHGVFGGEDVGGAGLISQEVVQMEDLLRLLSGW